MIDSINAMFVLTDTNIFLILLLLAVSIVFIVKGGDFFVDAASYIAELTGIPKFVIGATVVSVATTLPELFVSIIASAEGSVEMAVGNAVGSVTANVGLIMALSLLFMPASINRREYAPKTAILFSAFAIILISAWATSPHSLGVFPAILLVMVFAAFIVENIIGAKKSAASALRSAADSASETNGQPTEKRRKFEKKEFIINILKFVFGALGIVLGAQGLVDSGTEIALRLNVSEAVIGLTIVAIGTSLPELVTTITAIIKKQSSLSVGNIIGANVMNLTLIMPICAILTGGNLPITAQAAAFDIPVSLGVCAIALVPAMISGKFKRYQGVLLLAVYIAYLVLITTGVLKF